MLVVLSEPIWLVASAPVCVVVSDWIAAMVRLETARVEMAEICVVCMLCREADVRALTWVAVRTATCVVVSACTSVVLSRAMLVVVRLAICCGLSEVTIDVMGGSGGFVALVQIAELLVASVQRGAVTLSPSRSVVVALQSTSTGSLSSQKTH